MGCWNATCGLTHLPIMHGEEVVVVTLNESDYIEDPLIYCILENDGLKKVQSVLFGTYNDYGWIAEIAEDEDDRPDDRSFYFHKWAWDWCLEFTQLWNYVQSKHKIMIDSFIKQKTKVDSTKDEKEIFFIKEWTKDITGFSYEFLEENFENQDVWKPLLQLKVVLLVCQQMRKDPISMNQFAGSQIGTESLILHKRLMPLINNHIDNIEKKFKEDTDIDFDDGTNENLFWFTTKGNM